MVKQDLREELQSSVDEELIFFDNLSYDNSIIGITDDNRVAYSYSKMIPEAMEQLECDEIDAIEWIEYNTIRALGYFNEEKKPIIIYDEYFTE